MLRRDKGVTCTLSPLHSHASLLFFLLASPQARTAIRHVYLPVRHGPNAQSVWRDRRGRARGACVGGKTGGRGVRCRRVCTMLALAGHATPAALASAPQLFTLIRLRLAPRQVTLGLKVLGLPLMQQHQGSAEHQPVLCSN